MSTQIGKQVALKVVVLLVKEKKKHKMKGSGKIQGEHKVFP